jgi:diguanylate cyclase (GGDEF)-like protein/PAS domain S-box-containing protein
VPDRLPIPREDPDEPTVRLVSGLAPDSRPFLKALVGSAGLAIYSLDPAGRITSWNAAAERIFGWTQDDVMGRYPPFVPDSRWPEFQAILADARSGKAIENREFMRVAKDGRPLLLLASTTPMIDDRGQYVGYVIVASDITERRLLQGQFEALLRRSLDGFWIRDSNGIILDVNDAYCRLTGYSREEVVGTHVSHFIASGKMAAENARELGHGRVIETAHRTKGGESIALEASFSVLAGAVPDEDRIFAFFRDLRDRKQMEDRLKKRERRFRTLLEKSSDMLSIINGGARFIYVSPALESTMGYRVEELLGHSARDFIHPEDADMMLGEFQAVLGQPASSKAVEFRFRTREGQWRVWEAILTNALHEPDIGGVVCNGRDITSRREAEAQVRSLAMYDVLTGLPNRALLGNETRQLLARAARTQARVALLFIDLDRFKNINDSLGHAIGDEVLKLTAQRLRGAVREGDVVARLGGDEFVIVLPDIKSNRAFGKVAEKILDSTAGAMLVEGHELFVTPSIGIAVYPQDGHDIETLLKAADTAMYQAKGAGKNTFRFFEAGLAEQADARLRLENDLRRAVQAANDGKPSEFLVYYQPIIDGRIRQSLPVSSGSSAASVGSSTPQALPALGAALQGTLSAEALVRWNHPSLGLLAPDRFIGIAEETGLIQPLGDLVLRQVCDDMQGVGSHVARLRFSVNLSVVQIGDPHFAARAHDMVQAAGLKPGQFEFEVTESAFMQNEAQALATVNQLAAQGFGIVIDDFGTGYSSLGRLKSMPIAKLKIDKSFVQGVGHNDKDAAIVRSIIALAANLNLELAAEGVETEAQRDWLVASGCPALQGYLFAEPQPRDVFMARVGAG